MPQKTAYLKINNNRAAEEHQLLLEEKWIVKALSEIKHQRNCLQIERLHLESLGAQIKNRREKRLKDVQKSNEKPLIPSSTTSPTTINENSSSTEIETPQINILQEEATCNNEQLDLSVTNPMFSNNKGVVPSDMEVEEEDEYEDDEDSSDNVVIDMNMFMNGDT